MPTPHGRRSTGDVVVFTSLFAADQFDTRAKRPVNQRVFLSTFIDHDPAPITAKDLTAAELHSIQSLTAKKLGKILPALEKHVAQARTQGDPLAAQDDAAVKALKRGVVTHQLFSLLDDAHRGVRAAGLRADLVDGPWTELIRKADSAEEKFRQALRGMKPQLAEFVQSLEKKNDPRAPSFLEALDDLDREGVPANFQALLHASEAASEEGSLTAEFRELRTDANALMDVMHEVQVRNGLRQTRARSKDPVFKGAAMQWALEQVLTFQWPAPAAFALLRSSKEAFAEQTFAEYHRINYDDYPHLDKEGTLDVSDDRFGDIKTFLGWFSFDVDQQNRLVVSDRYDFGQRVGKVHTTVSEIALSLVGFYGSGPMYIPLRYFAAGQQPEDGKGRMVHLEFEQTPL